MPDVEFQSNGDTATGYLAEPERIGLHCAGIAMLALALVGEQQHRLVGAPREVGKGAIARHQAGPRIDHEHQRVREFDGGFGLLLHPRGQRALLAFIKAGSVDHGKFEVAKPRFAFPAVARHARLVIDQRKLLSDQAVEQGRLADIGPADDGDRERHE